MGYDAGTGNPEMIADWGYRSTHEMTLAAKSVIAKYYGRGASQSYFNGCSTGGHQALSEAQRHPEDYDGIIAGAPGHNRTHLHIAFLDRVEQVTADAQILSREKASLVSSAILAACGGKDGGAPGDTFLTNPAVCSFNPRDLLCAPGTAGDSCLSEREVVVASKRFTGTRNRKTNELIYPPFGIDGPVLGGGRPNLNPKDGADAIPRWVFGAQWDATTFDFDMDVAAIDVKIGPVVNAMDADLKRFTQHGGKLILFHGWSDQIVSPSDSIVYFDRINGIAASSGDREPNRPGSAFSRLFMAPGVGHCQGGGGPDSFGQASAVAAIGDPAQDIIAALDRWVVSGTAPEEIVASKIGQQGTVLAARPLCAYPKVAKYKGQGDPNSAASFACVTAPEGRIEFPAPRYLK
jgi:feruloyl esterase